MVDVARVAAAAALLLAAPAAAQQVVLQPGETLLEVQASGESTFPPDAAFINVGVVTTGTTAREATDANARQMAAVMTALTGAGVADRYLRTQQISVEPRFARRNPQDYGEEPHITGYVARNGVAVTVVKLATAPDVIAAAFATGANSVSGPNLGSTDPDKGNAAARAAAVASARSEAVAYAQALGMRVVRVLRVSKRGNAARPVDYVVTGGRVSSFASAPAAPPPPPPIAGGEMKRSITVWIDYALAPAQP